MKAKNTPFAPRVQTKKTIKHFARLKLCLSLHHSLGKENNGIRERCVIKKNMAVRMSPRGPSMQHTYSYCTRAPRPAAFTSESLPLGVGYRDPRSNTADQFNFTPFYSLPTLIYFSCQGPSGTQWSSSSVEEGGGKNPPLNYGLAALDRKKGLIFSPSSIW